MTSRTQLKLSPEVLAAEGEIVALRRDLHAHPELGFAERRTSAIVAERLRALGLKVQTGVATTGVVGLLEGAGPGRTVLIRADMDALPLPEESSAPYRSRNPEAMHACGHDGHVAMAVGAARVLAGMRERLHGNVKFAFQPAEEGPGGAEPMIEAGVLRDPPVDAAFGIHLWNGLEAGVLGVGSGAIMAAADEFELVIEGPGGHGAYPHQTVDTVLVAAHVVTAIQSIVSRSVSPLESAVVTVGILRSGHAFNIIPTTATLVGTLRSYRDDLRKLLPERVRTIAQGVAEAFGARARFTFKPGYPPTVNDKAMSAFAAEQAVPVFGAGRVIEPEPSMGGEDMSYFLRQVPGAFLFLGSANGERGLDAPHHSPRFDFDEAVLAAGTETFVRLALAYLKA